MYYTNPWDDDPVDETDVLAVGVLCTLVTGAALLAMAKGPWPLKVAAAPVATSFGLAAAACLGETIDLLGGLRQTIIHHLYPRN